MQENSSHWDDIWRQRTVLQEIKLQDFYSERPFILKYIPRNGLALEAGCGMGRYILYLGELGFNIIGIDLSKYVLKTVIQYAVSNNPPKAEYGENSKKLPTIPLLQGEVRGLPFKARTFSSYISIGVIEHFKEGPQQALREANFILQPGGIIIIATPNKFAIHYLISIFTSIIKLMLTFLKLYKHPRPDIGRTIFEYKYSAAQLSHFLKKADFHIIEKKTIGLKYSVYDLFRLHNKLALWEKVRRALLPLLTSLENTPIAIFGGISIAVGFKSNKTSPTVNCFFCSKTTVYNPKFSIPVCEKCASTMPEPILSAYAKHKPAVFHSSIHRLIGIPLWRDIPLESQMGSQLEVAPTKCHFCGEDYIEHSVFGNYGFNLPVCAKCRKKPKINLILSNYSLQEKWNELT